MNIKNKSGRIYENVKLINPQLKYCRIEKDAESIFDSYIQQIGWKKDVDYTRDTDINNRYKFRNNGKGSKSGKPDYIFYDDDKNIIAICDVKSSDVGIEQSIEDGKDYINCLKEDYNINIRMVFGFDGEKLEIQYLNDDSQWEKVLFGSLVVKQIPNKDILIFIIESNNNIEQVSETKYIDKKLLEKFFQRTDEIIRRSSIGSSPVEKFIELSTIIFLKMYTLKGYDKPFFEKKENKSLKYKHIWEAVISGDTSLINSTFSNWLNKTYNNIYLDDTHSLIRIESDKLIQIAKLIDRIFAVYELTDFTNVKGDILEYFQASSKDRKIGEFFTPRHIIEYMVNLIDPKVVSSEENDVYIEKVYDPTCGTGGFLIQAYNWYKVQYSDQIKDLERLKADVLHGTELKSNTALLAKLNMILIGDGHSNIINADALGYDKVEKEVKLKDSFNHPIVIEEEDIDYFKEGGENKYYIKGDQKRRAVRVADGSMEYIYDELGEKISVDDKDVKKKDRHYFSTDGYPLKKFKGTYYKQRPVKYYELQSDVDKIEYTYKNIKAVNPLLLKEKLNSAENNDKYHKNFGKFDIVLANQPFGLSEPPKADYYFIKHMIESLHDGKNEKTGRYGRIACIVGNGFLCNEDFKNERRELQKNYTIKAIISLPEKSFAPYVQVIKSSIILIEKRKPHPNEKTYFVNINNDGYTQDNKRKTCDLNDFKRLMSLWGNWDDAETKNNATGETEYVSLHKQEKGFAELHNIVEDCWAVNYYIKYELPKFKDIENVALKDYIVEYDDKKHPIEFADYGEQVEVKGVSKQYGIITSEIKEASEYNQKYKILPHNSIAYNPSRINVGSIALHTGDDSLISPSYVIFKIDETEFIPEYVIHFMLSKYGRNQIENFNFGTVRNSLSFEDLGKIEIPKINKNSQMKVLKMYQNEYKMNFKELNNANLLSELVEAEKKDLFTEYINSI